MDAADTDDGQGADALAHLGEALGGEREQRPAGEAAGFLGILHAGDGVAADGGV